MEHKEKRGKTEEERRVKKKKIKSKKKKKKRVKFDDVLVRHSHPLHEEMSFSFKIMWE